MAEIAAPPGILTPREAPHASSPWVRMLGSRVSNLTMRKAAEIIGSWIEAGRSDYVCVADVHSLMCARSDAEHRAALQGAGLVTPDGAPLVLAARMAGIVGVRRVCGPDLLLELCSIAEVKGWRNYFFGGAEGVAETLAERLKARYPDLIVAGVSAPPFAPLSRSDMDRQVAEINATRPDIVWIGLGCPKQEKWMAANTASIHGAVLVGVGAAFDYYSGRTRRAPALLRRMGLEWGFRLISEPRRLWRRYLVLGPKFIALSALHLLSGRICAEG